MTEMKDVIAARRRALGFTQEQLAQKIGVSAKVVSKWETGRSLPDTSFLPALCTALNIAPQELLFPGSNETEKNGGEAEPRETVKMPANRKCRAEMKTAEIIFVSALLFAAILFLVGFFVSRADYYGEYVPLSVTMFILSALFGLGGIAAFLILRAKTRERCTLADDKRQVFRITVFAYCLLFAVSLAVVCVLGSDYGGAEFFDFLGVIVTVFLLTTLAFLLFLRWNKRRK